VLPELLGGMYVRALLIVHMCLPPLRLDGADNFEGEKNDSLGITDLETFLSQLAS